MKNKKKIKMRKAKPILRKIRQEVLKAWRKQMEEKFIQDLENYEKTYREIPAIEEVDDYFGHGEDE